VKFCICHSIVSTMQYLVGTHKTLLLLVPSSGESAHNVSSASAYGRWANTVVFFAGHASYKMRPE
jgi:hypothetical protein